MATAVKDVIKKYDDAWMAKDLKKKSHAYAWFEDAWDVLNENLSTAVHGAAIRSDDYEGEEGGIKVQARFAAPPGQSWDARADDDDPMNDRSMWAMSALTALKSMIDKGWGSTVSKTVNPTTNEAYEVVGVYAEVNLEVGGWTIEMTLRGGEADTYATAVVTADIKTTDDADRGLKIDPPKIATGQTPKLADLKGGGKVAGDKAILFIRYDEPIYKGWGVK